MKRKKYFCDLYIQKFWQIWIPIAIVIITINAIWLFAFFWSADLELFVAMCIVAIGAMLFEYLLVYRIIWKKYEESVTKKQEDNEEDNDI